MSYINVIYDALLKIHYPRKVHCDSCSHYTKNKKIATRPRGHCAKHNRTSYSIEWCKFHTSNKRNMKYWVKKTVTECPICGNTNTYYERMYTDRPEKFEDRNLFEEVYDNCMEQ